MKLQSLLNQLELVRIKGEENSGEIIQDIIKLELIDLLVDYIGNQKVREKIDEISF